MFDYSGSPVTVLNTQTRQVYSGLIVSISNKSMKIYATDATIKLTRTSDGAWYELNTDIKFQFI